MDTLSVSPVASSSLLTASTANNQSKDPPSNSQKRERSFIPIAIANGRRFKRVCLMRERVDRGEGRDKRRGGGGEGEGEVRMMV